MHTCRGGSIRMEGRIRKEGNARHSRRSSSTSDGQCSAKHSHRGLYCIRQSPLPVREVDEAGPPCRHPQQEAWVWPILPILSSQEAHTPCIHTLVLRGKNVTFFPSFTTIVLLKIHSGNTFSGSSPQRRNEKVYADRPSLLCCSGCTCSIGANLSQRQ